MRIVQELQKLDFIRDYQLEADRCYFSTNKEVPLEHVMACDPMYEYIPLPFIPRNESGCLDAAKLEGMGYISSRTYTELQQRFIEAGIQAEMAIAYDNMEQGIAFDERIPAKPIRAEEEQTKGERPAIASNGLLVQDHAIGNLIDLFQQRASSTQNIIYVDKDGVEEQSYRELYKEAADLANGLQEYGLTQGDVVIFQLPDNKAFIECFWACLLLGVIPAPLSVLDSYGANNVHTEKFKHIWRHLSKPYVITTNRLHDEILRMDVDDSEQVKAISIEQLKRKREAPFEPYSWHRDEISLILFTSGSTGVPKGVTLSQKNMLGRTLGEIQLNGLDRREVDLNWMTLTHAAGLIWSHIRDVYLDIQQVQVHTELILNEPLLWLELAHTYKATITWAPNFAYALVNNYLKDDVDYGWDLSRLKYMFAGGESNNSKNLRKFLKRLEKYALPEEAVKPAFGMTETSSCITYYQDFSYRGSSDEDNLLPVGTPMPGAEIRIVNEQGDLLQEGEIGYVQGKGESITGGYYQNELANRESFTADGYLITGDMGYIRNNNLILTGRQKDIIILNGLNYFVQDIEAAVDDLPEVNASFTAATSVKNRLDGSELVLVFFSPQDESLLTQETKCEQLKELVLLIKNQIREKCLLNPDYVIPISSQSAERTDIGKKQRKQYQAKFLNGDFNDILQKIAVNNTGVIVKKEWLRKELGHKPMGKIYVANATAYICSVLEKKSVHYCTVEEADDGSEQDVLVDFYFYEEEAVAEISQQSIQSSLAKAHRYMKGLMGTTKRRTVLFPVKQSMVSRFDQVFRVNHSYLAGMLKTASLENPLLCCRLVDADELDAASIQAEADVSIKDEIVLYREGKRYVPAMKTLKVNERKEPEPIIPQNGLIVVAGGLGGVGLHVCNYLIQTYNSKLLIIGSSDVEAAENSNGYAELANQSPSIMYVKADVTEYEEVLAAIAKAEAAWNMELAAIFNLTGKLSAVGQGEFFGNMSVHALENETLENLMAASAVKLLGTHNLEKIRRQKKHAVMIVFSSLTAQFGGRGMGAYALANTFQDNYCEYLRNCGEAVWCTSWSMWRQTGLNAYGESGSAVFGGFQELQAAHGIYYLDYILQHHIHSSYVGINRDSMKMKCRIVDPYYMKLLILVQDEGDRNKVRNIVYELDPQLAARLVCSIRKGSFVSNTNLTVQQQKLIAIWERVLNITGVSMTDNIFDVGGNSLTIFQLVQHIADEFQVDIKPIDLMTYPNIYELSAYLSGHCTPNDITEINDRTSKNRDRLQQKHALRKNRRG
ncbi:SDR family NAD(P)-dependent oxidoreductase [Paenibacillus sp. MER 180]|uniref:SDR family NAD(P)-dependent oxidoreductase n=1 Tax=Paenibacillus sp. MER 180 TaxID=2939570 RepID=UPI00203FFCCD|nr:SDR family NAD(P)-dependent oxidoreductase [Paenibacillus sp. MER 180]MCM3291423.1 SDR family NAD(P)-dependent oxidoreductase [Paenibacillus sp. MER 180]